MVRAYAGPRPAHAPIALSIAASPLSPTLPPPGVQAPSRGGHRAHQQHWTGGSHTCTCAHAHTHMHACTHTHAHMHACTCTHANISSTDRTQIRTHIYAVLHTALAHRHEQQVAHLHQRLLIPVANSPDPLSTLPLLSDAQASPALPPNPLPPSLPPSTTCAWMPWAQC